MNSDFFLPKYRPRFYRAIIAAGKSASWVRYILKRWNRFTQQRALQKLENLSDFALRDIGLWREPESRVDEWWRMNPPP